MVPFIKMLLIGGSKIGDPNKWKVFFGTPHRVIPQSEWAQLAVYMCYDLVQKGMPDTFLYDIASGLPDTLHEISDFATFADRYKILTFFSSYLCAAHNEPVESKVSYPIIPIPPPVVR